jgi:predicted ATPase
MPTMPLRSFVVNGTGEGDRSRRLEFAANGPVRVTLRKPLTFLVGENGSGKTTLLEALAARCGIRPRGGRSYEEIEDERDVTDLSGCVDVDFRRPPPGGGSRPVGGMFLRADTLHEAVSRAGRVRSPGGDWREAASQSRGEGMLSLLDAALEASERMLFILDEPETGLSPARQLSLLCLLDGIATDGRSQAIVATHSPILMSHPDADVLWISAEGIELRDLDDVPHWNDMRRFMASPTSYHRHLFA